MKTKEVTAALLAVGIALAVSACGGSANDIDGATPTTLTIESTPTTLDRPTGRVDELATIATGRLHIQCVGSGAVTVLLLAGWGDSGDNWSAIEQPVAEQARVCSYARFGTGVSDPPTTSQTFATQAADLHDLLAEVGEPGPYVVLGHSFGGAEAVTFASMHPTEVAGLMLLDASPTNWPATVCSVPAYKAGCAVMRDPDLDPERVDTFAAFDEVAAIRSLGDLPLTVMTTAHRTDAVLSEAERARLDVVWDAGVAHWAGLSSRATVVTLDSGHHIELEHPDQVAGGLAALIRVIAHSPAQ
jgi:pimeloyl-ACP methyl ester carboxylesterase